ncbi:hypothetical protein L596_000540 [Steinernema carpocapsae]|uniref:Uncharacterized protein n=1 Tax=Steinernema carpocapsae TaxID=34508 RepID=A0A4U8UKU1_STECR|nr:hypothetical protein L596_000540 [Steinernema carpocapsae]
MKPEWTTFHISNKPLSLRNIFIVNPNHPNHSKPTDSGLKEGHFCSTRGSLCTFHDYKWQMKPEWTHFSHFQQAFFT